jgi:histidine triad (HIT) family protein
MDCIFCKIVKGEIPCYKIYEDEYCLAFLDINPLTKGHTLVIPKKHYARIDEMPEEDFLNFCKGLKKVIDLIKENISSDFNIIVNQGKMAGQEIFHLHVHIIPRYGNENIFNWNCNKLTEEEAKEILEKIHNK